MRHDLVALARKNTLRAAGLMSGTSADGIDVAVCDVTRSALTLLAFDTVPYPPAVRRSLFRLFDPDATLDELSRLNFLLGELFADALIRLCRRHTMPLNSIDLIGSHGQTVRHLPGPGRSARRLRSTLQIAEPCVIAERTGITTVADFRPRDIAAYGQGAPLVPYADFFLFQHKRFGRALQNIGGIANVTWLPASGTIDDVMAFDTGPGNMMIDRVTQLVTRGKSSFDRGGRLAARGTVDAPLLSRLLAHPYLRRRPPKSTGREEFGCMFTDDLYRGARRQGIAPLDILATVTLFTARSIAAAYRRFLPRLPEEVILCGGGARNALLRKHLGMALAPARVVCMDSLGLDPDAKEAVSFAILACATVRGLPGNVPAATGASSAVLLGKIIPGRS